MGCKYLTEGAVGKARKATSNRGDAPVAGRANKGVNRKAHAKLHARMQDFEQMRANKGYRPGQRDGKVQMRIDGGGYHRPGSLQR